MNNENGDKFMKNEQFQLQIRKDYNDELYIEFSDELLKQMGWDSGTILLWEEIQNENAWKVIVKNE